MKASVAELRVLDYLLFVVCGNATSIVVSKLLTVTTVTVSNPNFNYCFNRQVSVSRVFLQLSHCSHAI